MKRLISFSLAISSSLLLATPSRRSKEQVLHDLNSAVNANDGQAVLQLSAELKALVPVSEKTNSVHGGFLRAGTDARQRRGQRNDEALLRLGVGSSEEDRLGRHDVLQEAAVDERRTSHQKVFRLRQTSSSSTQTLGSSDSANATNGRLLLSERELQASKGDVKTFTITLKPGKLGIFADWKTGKITDVEHGAQFHQMGIVKGMILKEIDGVEYSEKLLESKIAGDADYQVTLAIPWKPASIFEDNIFHMMPEAVEEVKKQLNSEQGAEALSWIKTGGWYLCAYEGQPCKCVGEVRYGAPHENLWSPARTVTAGAIPCSTDVFEDPAPGRNKQCGCHKSGFSLTKNENSVSYLQESWIFLLRLLARMKMLPFTGDRRYHGLELWSARHGGHTGGTLERYWIEKYIVEQYQNIPGGACLEWGFYYVNWLSQCTNKYENKYEAVKYGQKQPSVEGNVVYASIYDFPAVVGGAGLQFNFICATELFEHLEKPYDAADALYKIMAPGGAVLFTVPQQAQYHKVPQDFLRYTKEGVKHVMETAGFCVPPQLMAGSGDFIFDVARNAGLQIQDFTIEELDEGYQRGYDAIADGAITIHAMAYKPPHALCR